MKKGKCLVSIVAGLIGILISPAMAVEPPAFKVSTAFGTGADAQVNEHNNNGVTAGSAGDLNTRTSSNGDRNEIVALRFDLSEHSLSNLAGVTLNLINFRDNSARRVALYGVKQGAIGGTGFYSTEDWDEVSISAFGDVPGLTVTDNDFTTQNLNSEQVTFLGEITFANLAKGTAETFSDPALTAFVRSYSGSKQVTFLVGAAAGYTSTGEARFASKEAAALEGGEPAGTAGDFAPYLGFQTGGGSVPPSVLISTPANGADYSLGAPVVVEVNATDDGTIAKVELFSGLEEPLTPVGEDVSAPYSFIFSPNGAGGYMLRAVATDNQGLTGEHAIRIDVGVAEPPSVSISSPAEGAVLIKGAAVVLVANATDDVSVAKVEFFAGIEEPLILIGEDTTAPFTVQFTPPTAGTYTIRAVGTDNLGLSNNASIAVTVNEPAENLRTVSTAFRLGADGQVNEHSDSISGLGSDLNTRTSVNGDRNEIVALRFDLSEHTLAELSEVTLNIVNFRNNSARQVALYGVRQGARGGTGTFSTEDWEEIGLAFGDIPGLLVTDSDYLTQSIDENNVTALGQITFSNLTKGTVETFGDPALTDFVRNYAGSKLVTFLLAAAPGYTSTGEARFASREAFALEGDTPGDEGGHFAPYLNFKTGSAVEAVRIVNAGRNGNEFTLQWSGGSGPFSIQRKTVLDGTPWVDAASGITGTTATIPMEGAIGFFRIQGR